MNAEPQEGKDSLIDDEQVTKGPEQSLAPVDGGVEEEGEDVRLEKEVVEAGNSPGHTTDSMEVEVATSSPSAAATGLAATPAVQKKFTSLNVNRRFLEKASPTLPAATVTISKPNAAQPSSRLSTITPSSRLTSAKLSTSAKPQPAGWGQVAPAASPSSSALNADPLPSSIASSSSSTATGGAVKPVVATNVPMIASPKLVTALTSGSINRSTSPQNKGSPGLRNAALAASGRSSTPSVSTPTVASSNKAPWAKVKADAAPTKASALSSDFPTAAEAAMAKQEAERRERAAAAEAAAKAEQVLQHLERFRGTSLGAGNHWDEMDDEDDLDEVVQFGDGTQYKVPSKKDEEEPVSKEERFKDVGHDRSWPPKSSEMAPPRPIVTTRPPSSRDQSVTSPSTQEPHGSRLFNSRAANTRMEIRGGEGLSLETEPLEKGYPNRDGRSFFRGRERDVDMYDSHSHSGAAPTLAPARAWGPLVQRQATLNPDAPKPVVLSPPSSSKSVQSATPALATPSDVPAQQKSEEAASPPPARPLRPPPAPAPARSTGSERALPPHLAASAPGALNLPPAHTERDRPEARPVIQATPYGARSGGAAGASAAVPALVARDESQHKSATTGDVQREEMLSAAERARKRRQEEEDRRMAEKERAKAKAAAIEEKIRLAKEEEERKQREAGEAEARRREARKAEENRQREAAAAAAAAAAATAMREQPEQLRQRSERPELAPALLSTANENAASRSAQKAASLLSPSDEAVSWRRGKPSAPLAPLGMTVDVGSDRHVYKDVRPTALDSSAPQPLRLLQRTDPAAPAAAKTGIKPHPPHPASLNNEQDLASSTGMEGWDVVINRIKDSIPAAPSEARIPTGPRATTKAARVAESKMAGEAPVVHVKLPTKAARVEIIAPTDEGAARQREAEQRQRDARQNRGHQSMPVSVLKPATFKPIVMGTPEEPLTRTEVVFDAPPVWNRFKIKVGSSHPPSRLPRPLAKAQAMRVASFKSDSGTPKPVNILTWDPPISNLSSRTLSRDDQFFPKKYRKGVVITNVSIPTAKLERKPRGTARNLADRIKPVVKVPTSRAGGREAADWSSNDAHWRANGASPAVIPKAPASMRAKSLHDSVGAEAGAGRRDAGSAVAFARSMGARDSSTPSPVSFMVNSELQADNSKGPRPLATSTSMLPSPNQIAPTWGQSSLTFAGLDSSESSRVTADRDHIKNVWAHPSGDGGEDSVPKQNSLRGIVDEFPSTMALSMQDLKADEGAAAQFHDVVHHPRVFSIEAG